MSSSSFARANSISLKFRHASLLREGNEIRKLTPAVVINDRANSPRACVAYFVERKLFGICAPPRSLARTSVFLGLRVDYGRDDIDFERQYRVIVESSRSRNPSLIDEFRAFRMKFDAPMIVGLD